MRQYIGARYVPKFMGTYNATQAYEALCVVDNGMGTSYISTIPTPANTPLTDTNYWAIYGASSGAIINLQNQIDTINNTTIPSAIDTAIAAYDTLYIVSSATSLADLNTALSALGKKCILILGADVNCEGGGTLDSNVVKVIGAGGKFTYTTLNDTTVVFPDNCYFESTSQIFDPYIIASGNNLEGEVLPIWWGITGTKNVDAQIPINRMLNSNFSTFHFTAGVYMANLNNSKSNRTFIMDKDVIIDGVIHAAVGASALSRAENVKWLGTVTSTLRVGTYNCRYIDIDNIVLLDKDTSYNGQQAQNGQPVGVHLYYDSSYVNIKSIVAGTVEARADNVRNGVLMIDNDGTHPSPDHVTVGSVIVNNSSMNGTYNSAVYALASPYLTIGSITIANNDALRCVQFDRCPYAHIGNISITDASTNGVSVDYGGNGAMGKIDNLIIYSSGAITAAVSCTGGSSGLDLTIDNMKATGTITHGINAATYARVTVVRGTIVATNPTTQDATSSITKLS